jgi:hypothetical protein
MPFSTVGAPSGLEWLMFRGRIALSAPKQALRAGHCARSTTPTAQKISAAGTKPSIGSDRFFSKQRSHVRRFEQRLPLVPLLAGGYWSMVSGPALWAIMIAKRKRRRRREQ